MNRTSCILFVLLLLCICPQANAQVFDEAGNDLSEMPGNRRNGNFNPHNNDTTKKSKEVPKGIHVWTVDRKFGDIRPATVDTLPHLFPHATMNTGINGQFNTIGNNYSARQNRIFIDRPVDGAFSLIDAYSYMNRRPDEWHFTSTLSPITNLWYDNCGDKTNGEDHLDVKFAANMGKKFGFGFNINYAYARGYFQNQSTSHFNSTIYGAYLGDHYQAHLTFSINHQKAAENGGIVSDDYIMHADQISESYSNNEIPVVLSDNWNRDHNFHVFLTHRYNVGFYREVPMTEDEIKARKFAEESRKEKEEKENAGKKEKTFAGRPDNARISEMPKGRPDNAVIAGNEPAQEKAEKAETDTTRIKVDSKEMADSLLAEMKASEDTAGNYMKKEFVPTTSFIHTVEFDHYNHSYQAYKTPENYYSHTYFDCATNGVTADSIYDNTRYLHLKNTAAIGLLEGFNKWAKAGVKVFATHQLRRYDMAALAAEKSDTAVMERWAEHNISIGGMISKTQGRTLHYRLMGEIWLVGEESGQLKLDFHTDLNFPLFGDTVRLGANAYFYRLHPDFFFRHYHSKHIWWDNTDLQKTTRTRIEGNFSYEKTKTRLRVGIEEIQNYTYLGMSYNYIVDRTKGGPQKVDVEVMQQSSNINVLTAQLFQPLALGPLHWDNTLTYQSSSSMDALPLPKLNVFSNLYLKFSIARVLTVELGAAATYFTRYEVPDFVPMVNQFAIQQTESSRVTLGNQPFVDVYANMHLKHARFFVMMSNLTGNTMNRTNFLAPHYPLNNSVLHLGVSWNFFN